MSTPTSSLSRSARFSWFLVGYTVLVIAWGAWVRLSGSGDGCGDDWPRCNGAVIPWRASVQTLIEYSHRLSTAVYGVLVLIRIFLARRLFPAGHRCRFWSVLVLVFTITEALIGRSLVKEGLVDQSTDTLRLIVMPLHLINTSFLLLSCVMTAELFRGQSPQRVTLSPLERRRMLLSGIGLGILLTTGAIAALGSHLDPSSSLIVGIQKDLSPDSHLAVRLRWLHPLLALVASGLFAMNLFGGESSRENIPRIWRQRLSIAFFATVVVGIATLGLLSPLWLKISHLILANVLVIIASRCFFHSRYHYVT